MLMSCHHVAFGYFDACHACCLAVASLRTPGPAWRDHPTVEFEPLGHGLKTSVSVEIEAPEKTVCSYQNKWFVASHFSCSFGLIYLYITIYIQLYIYIYYIYTIYIYILYIYIYILYIYYIYIYILYILYIYYIYYIYTIYILYIYIHYIYIYNYISIYIIIDITIYIYNIYI